MTEGKAARSVSSKHKIARRFAARRLIPAPYLVLYPLFYKMLMSNAFAKRLVEKRATNAVV